MVWWSGQSGAEASGSSLRDQSALAAGVAAGTAMIAMTEQKRGGIAGRESLKRGQNRADEHVAESVSLGSQFEPDVMCDG